MKAGYIQLAAKLTLGTPRHFTVEGKTTRRWFRPRALIINAAIPGFGVIDHLFFGEFSALVVPTDAYCFCPSSLGISIDLPTISPSDPIAIQGSYTGAVPKAFSKGNGYELLFLFFEGQPPSFLELTIAYLDPNGPQNIRTHEKAGEQTYNETERHH